MNLSKSFRALKNRLLLSVFSRADKVESFLEETNDRYIDVSLWASMRGLSTGVARKQLLDGVRLGHIEQCMLYEWSDAPTRFVLPLAYVGKTIRLSEIGYFGDDEDREVELHSSRVREVFIARSDY